nr:MAG: hypothetical protein H4RhizoLitter20221_000001 [Mitovirus sp.]
MQSSSQESWFTLLQELSLALTFSRSEMPNPAPSSQRTDWKEDGPIVHNAAYPSRESFLA